MRVPPVRMEDSFRNAVCTRVLTLAGVLDDEATEIPPPPRVVSSVQYETVPVPVYVHARELLLLGVLIGVALAIAVVAARSRTR